MNLNRIKCAASIDATGSFIVVGAAAAGFKQPPTDLWVDGSYMTGGNTSYHEYLLELGTQWELGFVDGVDSYRHVVESNVSAGVGFSAGATGLTLSFVVGDMNLVSCPRTASGSSSPRASGGGLAAGLDALCDLGASVALGQSAQAYGSASMAIGAGSSTFGNEGLALGYAASSGGGVTSPAGTVGAVAIGSWASAPEAGSIAIGHYAGAPMDYQVTMGSPIAEAFSSEIPLKGTADSGTGTVTMTTQLGVTVDFSLMGATATVRAPGPIRIQGTVFVQDTASTLSSHAKVFSAEYIAWVDTATNTVTVLGSPTITAIFTGASAPNSTLSISSAGVPQIASTSGTGVAAKAMLKLDVMVVGHE